MAAAVRRLPANVSYVSQLLHTNMLGVAACMHGRLSSNSADSQCSWAPKLRTKHYERYPHSSVKKYGNAHDLCRAQVKQG